jgi:hypothetical protein
MKFYTKISAALILMGLFSFTACSDAGSDSPAAAAPDPYVSFTCAGDDSGVGAYSSGGQWIEGVSDAGFGSEPICSWVGSTGYFYGAGLKITKASGSFNKDTMDHVYIMTDDNKVKTFPGSNCVVQIRLTSGVAYQLTSQSVTITHFGNDYVQGTFTGTDPNNGYIVNGSFVFTNVGDNNWPLPI